MYIVILFSSSKQSDCVIFFHDSNNNRFSYSGVLQSAQFCLFKMHGCSGAKIAKSSPPVDRTVT